MMNVAAWLPLLFQTKAPARTLGPRKGQWRVRHCLLPTSLSLPTRASSPPLSHSSLLFLSRHWVWGWVSYRLLELGEGL